MGLFLYLLRNSPLQPCFSVLGAVNTLLSKAEPEVVQEGSLDWGAEVTKLPEKHNFLARRAKAVSEGL